MLCVSGFFEKIGVAAPPALKNAVDDIIKLNFSKNLFEVGHMTRLIKQYFLMDVILSVWMNLVTSKTTALLRSLVLLNVKLWLMLV